ncbi:MAG: CrcB protein [Frankiales bacterium]|nr:CrcB protein [Frankiales bacterium]
MVRTRATRGDAHPELPLDPDSDRLPAHLRPLSIALVATGGFVGTSCRYALERTWPATDTGWPVATFAANVTGSLVLGFLLEALLRSGSDTGRRRHVRLLAGVGFCGAFTTYSALAVEVQALLAPHAHAQARGIAYALATVVCGFVATAAGILIGQRAAGGRRV